MHYVSQQGLASPICRAVGAWYDAGRVGGGWPPVSALFPADLPATMLANIGSVDVDPDGPRVFYRIMGGAIAASLGVDGTGRWLDDLNLPQAPDIRALYRDSIEAEGPLFGRGEVTLSGESHPFEAGTLPFGSSGDRPRRFAIVEDYFDMPPWRPALRQRRYDLR
jgi:hypothetical protein